MELSFPWLLKNGKMNLSMSMGSRENKQNKVRTQLWDTLYMSQWFRMLPGLVDTGAPDQRGQRYGDVEILAGAGGHSLHGGMSGWCQDGVRMVSGL